MFYLFSFLGSLWGCIRAVPLLLHAYATPAISYYSIRNDAQEGEQLPVIFHAQIHMAQVMNHHEEIILNLKIRLSGGNNKSCTSFHYKKNEFYLVLKS